MLAPDCRSPANAYRGRFAPTPSGPLHLGSLLTALASYLDARAHQGQWLLRIDDLDRPRCVAGADSLILQQLEAHGLHWDEPPRYQSQHLDAYEAQLQQLRERSCLYACDCTRARLAQHAHHGLDGPVYDGHCRNRHLPFAAHAWRYSMPSAKAALDDLFAGIIERDLQCDVGDIVVRRRDGIVGYHLACIVDEQQQRISHVIRGADLLASSFAQQALMHSESLAAAPRYGHLPLLCDAAGRKLSKQNHAPALDIRHPSDNIWQCLLHLQQEPPSDLQNSPASELLSWAIDHWQRERVPPVCAPVVPPP